MNGLACVTDFAQCEPSTLQLTQKYITLYDQMHKIHMPAVYSYLWWLMLVASIHRVLTRFLMMKFDRGLAALNIAATEIIDKLLMK